MPFNSWVFVIFCAIVFILYYLPVSKRIQPAILIAASFFFYAYNAPYLLCLLVVCIVLNTGTSYCIVKRPEKEKLLWASIGVVINVLILSVFKYSRLFAETIMNMIHASNAHIIQSLLLIPLPIGISFYTFEGISLTVDIIRGRYGRKQDKETRLHQEISDKGYLHHLYRTSLFIAFFPHLISGPILRASAFYSQIGAKYFKDIPWAYTIRTLILGYFLKMVIADNLPEYTKWMSYPRFYSWGGITNLSVMIGMAVQLFCDFAGYSFIAIGVSLLFGYRLPLNFNRPLNSASLTEFWTRWHMSLSSWLRDYLYRPLRGEDSLAARAYIAILLVMLIGGLWHGAAWHYMLWGGYFGTGIIIERIWRRYFKKNNIIKSGNKAQITYAKSDIVIVDKRHTWKHQLQVTAIFLVCCASITFFVLPNPLYAFLFYTTLLHPFRHENPAIIIPIVLYLLPVGVYHLLSWEALCRLVSEIKLPVRLSLNRIEELCYGLMLFMIVLNSGDSHAFIYFQF